MPKLKMLITSSQAIKMLGLKNTKQLCYLRKIGKLKACRGIGGNNFMYNEIEVIKLINSKYVKF